MQQLPHRHHQGTAPAPARQAALHSWLTTIPHDSLTRLREINTSTSSSRHVILALTFALYDPYIRRLNRMITALLVARMKADRAGKLRLVARINCVMDDMHEAIDLVTGTRHVKSGPPCNRVAS